MKKRKFQGNTTVAKRYKPTPRIPRILRNPLLTETNYLDSYVQDTNVQSIAVVNCINQIAQGDGTSNRSGNQVLNKYIHYNFQLQTSAGIQSYVVWVILDRQPNNALPLISDIIDTTTISVQWGMKNIRAFQNRFKILRVHRGFVASANGGAGVTNATNEGAVVTDYIDCTRWPAMDRVTRYAGTSAGVPNTNSILVAYMCNTITANLVTLNGGFRVAFDEN